MSIEYAKVKSVAKQVVTKGPVLSGQVLKTLKTISDAVGDTLGPGGRPSMIERYEHDMPPMITKDGVTVFRSLGFKSSVQHCIMEIARDASIRTASEAGDGTTTAAILTEAITRLTNEYCTRNRRVSPQKIVRFLESQFRDVIEPTLRAESIKADFSTEEGQKLLKSVAKISANGDGPLADAVMQCFDLVGDEGNVTIVEVSGKSSYQVEEIDGYPIPMGYEESCIKYASKFINDPGTNTCRMDSPVFVLYNGDVNDITTAYTLLAKVGDKFEELIQGIQNEYRHPFVVFVAVGFSESVISTFAGGWHTPNTIKIFPLTIPKWPTASAQVQFLEDLSAITGATIFNPLDRPLDLGTLEDLGPGCSSFEATRFRSAIIGKAASLGQPWEDALLERVEVVKQQLLKPESEYDARLIQERLGKLTGGIAKLRVIGASNGELKEKRDRAEDSVCAVRGAIKHGCLPGGGWALMKVVSKLEDTNPINAEILKPALMEPIRRLLSNCGLSEDEFKGILDPILQGLRDGKKIVYDALEQVHGDAIDLGVLDSTPAVLEATRNSISCSSQLGTLGSICVFNRDEELERTEARATSDFIRQANTNEADERQ